MRTGRSTTHSTRLGTVLLGAGVLMSALVGTGLAGDSRTFQVYLANPRPQWIPGEPGADAAGGCRELRRDDANRRSSSATTSTRSSAGGTAQAANFESIPSSSGGTKRPMAA